MAKTKKAPTRVEEILARVGDLAKQVNAKAATGEDYAAELAELADLANEGAALPDDGSFHAGLRQLLGQHLVEERADG